MKTSIEFIDAVKARQGGISDYAVSKILGVTPQTVSKYRVGKDFLGDSTAMKVAELLGEDPAYVVACAHAERAKSAEEKALWARIFQVFSGLSQCVHTPNDGADAVRLQPA